MIEFDDENRSSWSASADKTAFFSLMTMLNNRSEILKFSIG